MSKTTENAILIPGEGGWEVWTRQNEENFTLHSATETSQAGELDKIPGSDLTMFFPVKSITAVPMRVASDDDALFADLATLHAERLGLRPDPMAGQLTDLFVIGREEENTALLSVFLRSPRDGDLPTCGPKGFDLSPRAFPVSGDTLILWKEFGRWVFAIYHQEKLAYCQATAVNAAQPDASLAREVRLSLIQLGMQGLEFEPSRITVWSADPEINTTALTAEFNAPVEVSEKPAPVLPDPLSKLLPADVRAARRDALRRRNVMLGVAAAVVFYLGLVGWFGYGLWQTSSDTKELLRQAEATAPEGKAYALHIAKWDELSHAIDLTNAPVDILKRIATCIPPKSGLRLKTADISADQIKLLGEAPKYEAVKTFSLRLSNNNDLTNFPWQTPEPNQGKLGWEFVFGGEVPILQSQP